MRDVFATMTVSPGEKGMDIEAEQPKILTTDAVKTSDAVIIVDCGDAA